MYFLYVDESGDKGLDKSPTKCFVLSGLVVHELKWFETLETITNFRRFLKEKYGVKLREEIHASHLIHNPGDLARIPKSLRLQVLREIIDFEAQLSNISIINVIVDKQDKMPTDDIFDKAWGTLIQRFHNTIAYKNFPGPQNPQDYGLLVVDQTDEPKLRILTRKMRKYNPVPSMFGGGSMSIPITTVVEDPVHRNSLHSYFIQLADVNAFFLYQMHYPCKYIQQKGGKNYFKRLNPVLCKVASKTNEWGIVYR